MKGFTFVELLVSITIIAVLAAIGAVSYSSTSQRSRDTKRLADVESIRSALELYRSEQGEYPALQPGGLGCLTSTKIEDVGSGIIYLNPIPTDPRNDATYCYRYRLDSPTTYTLECTLESGAACTYENP